MIKFVNIIQSEGIPHFEEPQTQAVVWVVELGLEELSTLTRETEGLVAVTGFEAAWESEGAYLAWAKANRPAEGSDEPLVQ